MNRVDLATMTDAFALPDAVRSHDALGHAVVQHPQRVNFYFGNLLVLDVPPGPDDLLDRIDHWRTAFETLPAVSRILLQWETPGAAIPFARDELIRCGERFGLALDSCVVLHSRTLITPPVIKHVETRPLADDDWGQLLELQLEGIEDDAVRSFWSWRLETYRALIARDSGTWWGVFEDGALTASGGLFWSADCARYQEISTATRFRCQGRCAHLCHMMGQWLLDRKPDCTLVVVADEGGPAERIYRRLGFSIGSRQWTLWGERATVVARRIRHGQESTA